MKFKLKKRGFNICKNSYFLKLSILVLLILILSFSVLAQDYETNQSAPIINITFNEQINIDSVTAEVTCALNSGICFDTHQSGIVAQTPNDILVSIENNGLNVIYFIGFIPNDEYNFTTTVEDLVGNSQSYNFTFLVDATLMDISIYKPTNAWSNQTPFTTIIVPANIDSDCWYSPGHEYRPLSPSSNYAYSFDFNNTASQQRHFYLYNVSQIHSDYNEGDSFPFYVACNANDEEYGWADLRVYWDTTAPVYIHEFYPSPLTDIGSPYVDIIVNSLTSPGGENADDIGCEIAVLIDNGTIVPNPEYETFDSVGNINSIDNYSQINTHQLDFTHIPISNLNSHEYQYEVRCRNKAGIYGDLIIEDLVVQFSPEFTITQIKPPTYVNLDVVPVEVETSVLTDWCNISRDNLNVLMTKEPDNRTHLYSLSSLSEGEYDYDINCKSTFGSNSQSQVSFTVDRTPPYNITVDTNDYTCSLSKIQFEMNADDDISGVDYFNYTIIRNSDSTVLVSKITSNNNVEYSHTLIENESYTISVIAFDRAENSRSMSPSKTIVATRSDIVECDLTAPTITFTDVKEPGITVVNISCSDSKSGCKDSFDYSLLTNLSDDCTYSTAGSWSTTTQFSIWESNKFCVRAMDNNNNEKEASEIITVNYNVSTHCSNGIIDFDETGVDCGGTECFSCDAGAACLIDGDCRDRWCNNGICDIPECDDGLINGFETGVDCGGDCVGCEINASCLIDEDCLSLWCDEGYCHESSCDDYISNGLETDVDCGGIDCMPCDIGQSCFEDSDCVSEYCDYGTCQPKEPLYPIDPIGEEGMFSTIFLILGILLVLLGVGYILYEHYYIKPGQKTIPASYHKSPTKRKLSSQEIMRLRRKRDMMKEKFKKRSSSTKDRFSTKLSVFDENTDEIKSAKEKEEFKEAKGIMAKLGKLAGIEKDSSSKQQSKLDKGLKGEYVHLDDLKKNVAEELKDDPNFNEKVAGDVFAALEKMQAKVEKKTKSKKDDKDSQTSNTTYVTEEDFKKLDEAMVKTKGKTTTIDSKKEEPTKPNQTNEEVFSALNDIASKSKKKQKTKSSTSDIREAFSSDELVELFKKQELNTDVFKVILSELLKSNKLTKTDVSGIVFKLLEQELIEKDIAHKILKDLKLINE